MIRSFKDPNTKRFFEGRRVRAFEGFTDQAARRLAYLDNAEDLRDLANLRSNRFESLSGDRAGQYPNQSAVADLFSLGRGWPLRR